MNEAIPGAVMQFQDRAGGYLNYLHGKDRLSIPQDDISHYHRGDYPIESHLHTQEQVDQMLDDANTFLSKYFPWIKDFVIFQLEDGTIRLDAADRAFLGDE